jgi:DNA-binding Lrp family transcriptional regulator
MDKLDREILFHLFKDGRSSLYSISSKLGLDYSRVVYRYNRLLREVIQGFTLYVNPNLLGLRRYYGVTDSTCPGSTSLEFRCVEGYSFCELFAREESDWLLFYSPEQVPLNPSKVDLRLISALREDPRASPSQLSRHSGIPLSTVKRHLRYLEGRGLIRVFPNLRDSNFLLFSVISESEQVRYYLSKYLLAEIGLGDASYFLCHSPSVGELGTISRKVRELDNQAKVLVKDYFGVRDYYVNLLAIG